MHVGLGGKCVLHSFNFTDLVLGRLLVFSWCFIVFNLVGFFSSFVIIICLLCNRLVGCVCTRGWSSSQCVHVDVRRSVQVGVRGRESGEASQ